MNGILRTMHVASWELPATLEDLAACEVPTIEEQDDVAYIRYIDNSHSPYPIIIEPDVDGEDTRELPAILMPDYVAPDGDTVTIGDDEDTTEEEAA